MHCAGLMDPEVAQRVDHLVGGFSRDVGENQVARRLQGRSSYHRQAAHIRGTLQDLDHVVGQLSGGGDAQGKHVLSLTDVVVGA